MYKKSIISSDNSITEPSISSLVSIGIYDSLCISLNASSSKNTIGFGKVNWGNDDFQIPIIAPFVSVAVVGVIDLTNEKWRWLDALKQWLNE